ncbi:MAG: YfbK domain-containing protein, partial [Verrucomicrobiota bacterium]
SGPGGADSGSKGPEAHAGASELMSLQVGFRPPAGDPAGTPRPGDPKASGDPAARSLRVDVPDASRPVDAATADYKFAAAVVGYGLLLRDSPYKGDLTWDKVLALAEEGQGPDREGYRMEFLQLVRRAQALHGAAPSVPGAPVRPRP